MLEKKLRATVQSERERLQSAGDRSDVNYTAQAASAQEKKMSWGQKWRQDILRTSEGFDAILDVLQNRRPNTLSCVPCVACLKQ